MWKVVTHLAQIRSLSTFSHNFSSHKGLPYSDTEYVQKKQRYKQTEDFGRPEKKHFRSRGSGYQDRNGNSANSESRHNSFSDIDDNSWEESAERNKRYSNNTDSYKPVYRYQEKGQYGEPRERGNANLSEIGVPGKWKVGAGFVKESDRLREIQDRCRGDFKKMAQYTIKRDPGVRRRAKALEEFSDPNLFPREEDLDGEVDVVKFDKVYDKYQQDKQDLKELNKLRIVKQKYFKDATEEKTLTWSDKEHIRFLHNSDPQQWTIEMIAEHFRIEPHVAKAVASAKWIPKKSKLHEEISSNSNEIYSPVNGTGEQQTAERQSFEDKQRVTWQEVAKDMGIKGNAESRNESNSKPASVELEDVGVDKNLVFQYLSRGSPSKWASPKPNQMNVKHDEAEEVRQVIEKQISPQRLVKAASGRWRFCFMFLFATMAEDAQRRVESALSSFVDEIEKSNLRKMQRSSWKTGLVSDSCLKSLNQKELLVASAENQEKRITLVDLSSSIDISHIVEEDDVKRLAYFYVYATKLQSLASAGGNSMGMASGFLDLKPLMHWSVVVKFESPESVYTLDADTAGGLTGAKFVVKVKREYPEKGKYDFIFANCQSWAHKFCCEISPDFAANLPVTIGDCTTIAATIGVSVISLGAAGIGIAWALCKLLQNRKSKLPSSVNKEEENDQIWFEVAD
ncbi:hypothetical protein GHT06_017618 [Daphnia sinensis]|uniref:Neurite outgrowth-associated protein n=1 Tax=Daphnia sinensis TaxID=1820382 RepID=A0AAD5PRK0_9CRUS|nr:hypothetical protein GHT06_017618 [Daphnia sinensis]